MEYRQTRHPNPRHLCRFRSEQVKWVQIDDGDFQYPCNSPHLWFGLLLEIIDWPCLRLSYSRDDCPECILLLHHEILGVR